MPKQNNKTLMGLLGIVCMPALLISPLHAQEDFPGLEKGPLVFWGVSFEQLEYRFGDESDVLAWHGDAFVGTDEWKVRLKSEGEYLEQESVFETLENQLTVQRPISAFFDAKAGIRFDTPEGVNRTYAVIGTHGLAPQWFEVDADVFVSDEGDVSARLDADYELLITNRVILTSAAEINVAFSDDEEIGVGSGLSDIEVGLRVSYDLVERDVAPYIGVHYERKFGKTADFAREEGEDTDEVFFVAGVRISF
ncbi:MAG: copper resistance protein B [Caldilineaceae bacterium]|nr:copper resistance protein B [Caldilineaceae bacterium]